MANIVRIYVHCHKQRLVVQGYGFAIKAEGALRSGSETFTANDRNLIAQKKLYIGNGELGKIRGKYISLMHIELNSDVLHFGVDATSNKTAS